MHAQSTGRLNVDETPHRLLGDSAGPQQQRAGPSGQLSGGKQSTGEQQPKLGTVGQGAALAGPARSRQRRSAFKFPSGTAAPAEADAGTAEEHAGDDDDDDDDPDASGEEAVAADGSDGSEDTSEAVEALSAGQHCHRWTFAFAPTVGPNSRALNFATLGRIAGCGVNGNALKIAHIVTIALCMSAAAQRIVEERYQSTKDSGSSYLCAGDGADADQAVDAFEGDLGAAIRSLEEAVTDERVFLRPSADVSAAARAAAKALFDHTGTLSAAAAAGELYVEGFDAEQIWGQLELQVKHRAAQSAFARRGLLECL